MNPHTWFESFIYVLLRASWQASVLIVIILLLRRVLRKVLPPEWRFWLWILVLVRLSVPFSLESPWSIFNYSRFRVPATLGSEQASSLGPSAVTEPFVPVPAGGDAAAIGDDAFRDSRKYQDTSLAGPSMSPPPQNRLPLRIILPFLWCLGVLIFGSRVILGHRRLAGRLHAQAPSKNAILLGMLHECAGRVGLRRLPLIVETDAVESPAIFGMFKPRLLLPASAVSSLTAPQLRCVILHELCHLRRRDVLLNWLTTALQVLHWYNPLVWLASNGFRADRELACDARALGHLNAHEAREYGRTIIRLLEGFAARSRVPAMVGIVESIGHLKLRLAMIGRIGRRPFHRVLLAGFIAALLGLVTLTDARAPGAGAEAASHLDLFLFQGCTSAPQACPCEPPRSVQAEIEKASITGWDFRASSEQLQVKVRELSALREKYPREVAVHKAYQTAVEFHQGSVPQEEETTLDALLVEYRSLAQRQPDDALSLYLYGEFLLRRDRAEARRFLLAALEIDADFAWPHLSLARLDWMENRKEEEILHLRAFLDKCPCNLEAHSLMIRAAPAQQALREIPKMRALLRRDPVVRLGPYLSLWDTEFELTPIPEQARVRQAIAGDVAVLRRLNRVNDPAWWTILQEGYKRSRDQKGLDWVRAERLRQMPATPHGFSVARQNWLRENPYPGNDAPQERREAYRRARLEASAAWIRQWPDDLHAWMERFATISGSPGASAAEADAAIEGMLKILEQNPGTVPFGSPNDPHLLVASYYTRQGIRLDRVPGLVEKALQGIQASSGVSPYGSQIAERNRWQGLSLLAEAYIGMHQFDEARSTLGRMDDLLAQQSSAVQPGRAAQYRLLQARLADGENRKSEAIALYQSVLRDRVRTIPMPAARAADPLIARTADLWRELRRPATDWQVFLSDLEEIRSEESRRRKPAWKSAQTSLPDFRLADAQGRFWNLSDLKGKVCFIQIWAVWSSKLDDNLKPVREICDRLDGRADVLCLTLNADVYTPQIEPFLREKGYTFPVIPAYRYIQSIQPFTGTPQSWIVDKSGTIRLQLLGNISGAYAVNEAIARIDQVAQQ